MSTQLSRVQILVDKYSSSLAWTTVSTTVTEKNQSAWLSRRMERTKITHHLCRR